MLTAAASRTEGNYIIFFTENLNNCVRLTCQETFAMYEEFSVKRHCQTNMLMHTTICQGATMLKK